jgi:uncharacterized protein (TIGR02266 family)
LERGQALAENGKERRVHPRKDVSLRVRVKADNVDDFVEQFAHNISKGGLFLRSQKPYPVDTELHFEIQLKGGSSVMRGKGKVTWSQPPAGPGEKQRNCGMGVKFIGLDASSKALVERILEHKEEVQSPPEPAPSPAEDVEEGPTVEVELTPPEQVPVVPAPAKPEPDPVEQRATPAPPFWRRVPLRIWLLLGGAALGALVVLLFLSLPTKEVTAVAPPEKEPVSEKIEPPAPPAPEPVDPPVAEPAAEEPAETIKEAEIVPLPVEKKSPAKRRYGYLSLNTNPWVEVYLGSRKLGVTPLVRVKLRAGRHRLKLVNWEKGINSPLVVKIRPGKTTKQVKRFSP